MDVDHHQRVESAAEGGIDVEAEERGIQAHVLTEENGDALCALEAPDQRVQLVDVRRRDGLMRRRGDWRRWHHGGQ